MSARWLKTYGLALAVFLALDAVWLGLVARSFYRQQLGFLLAESPNWAAAGVFYLLFIAGLVHFVVTPAAGAPGRAALRGAFFGLVTYATYDLTNLATVAGWPLAVTLVDLAWGAALGAATAGLTVRFGPRKG
jgi:uncharacterized membrane protein